MHVAVRSRFDRETIPEPYEAREAGLELGRRNRLRRESAPPPKRQVPPDAMLVVALAVAFIVFLAA